MEEVLFKWIPTVGFPIAVAMYLLIRVEPKLAALSDVIKELVLVVRTNTDTVKELVLVVRSDTENTKEMKNAIISFTLSINDLKNEISKINK